MVNVIWGINNKGDTQIDWVELKDSDKITEIVENAFNGCSSLRLNKIPENVTFLNKGTFNQCTSLEEIDFQNVETIDTDVFFRCTGLVKINIPKLKTIGRDAFGRCTSLQEVTLGSINNPVQSLDSRAFFNCTQNNLTIKIFIDTSGGASSLEGQPWGATNATIEYYDLGGNKIN